MNNIKPSATTPKVFLLVTVNDMTENGLKMYAIRYLLNIKGNYTDQELEKVSFLLTDKKSSGKVNTALEEIDGKFGKSLILEMEKQGYKPTTIKEMFRWTDKINGWLIMETDEANVKPNEPLSQAAN